MSKVLVATFVLAFAAVSISPAQSVAPTPKPRDRTKSFGQSLDPKRKQGRSSSSAATPALDEAETIRVKTDLVVADVLVVNDKGNLILGLKKDDFEITEDGATRIVEYFGTKTGDTPPRSIVLIFDYSGSLAAYLKESLNAAKAMIDKLDAKDRVAIVTDDMKLLTDFTSDKKRLRNVIDDLTRKALSSYDGRSLQLSSFVMTLNEMFDDEDVRPVVIIQSDGDEYWSLKRSVNRKYSIARRWWMTTNPCYGLCENASFDDILALAARSRATIYSIVPGTRLIDVPLDEQLVKVKRDVKRRNEIASDLLHFNYDPSWARDTAAVAHWLYDAQIALKDLAVASGGYIDFIEQPGDSEKVYTTLFQTMSNRYSVGYYPDTTARNRQWLNVKVSVRNHPEYTVVGRKRFFVGN